MTMMRSVVLGHGAYLPERILTNAELAKMVDTSLGQSLLMGEGSQAIFVTRPISAALLAAGFVYLVATVIVYRRMAKTALFKKLPVAD